MNQRQNQVRVVIDTQHNFTQPKHPTPPTNSLFKTVWVWYHKVRTFFLFWQFRRKTRNINIKPFISIDTHKPVDTSIFDQQLWTPHCEVERNK